MRLALDIETDPIPEMMLDLPAPEVATGNIKDPAKIAEKLAEAKRRQIARMALDPHFGRVLAWAVVGEANIHTETMIRLPGQEPDAAERALLLRVWELLSKAEQLYTFNGAGFDLPFLMRRSLLLGVPPYRIEVDKYRVRNFAGAHVDLYQLLQAWEVGNGQGNPLGYARDQAFYAQAILGSPPPYGDIDKNKLGELYAAGELETIHQLVTWDATTTWQLAQRLRAVYP